MAFFYFVFGWLNISNIDNWSTNCRFTMMYNWKANCILCNTNGCAYFTNDYEGSEVLLVHSFTGISTCITSVTFIYYYLMQAKWSCFHMKRKRISYITSIMKRKRIKWKTINHMTYLANLACVYVCSIHFRFCSVAINRDKSTIVCVITMILSIVEINFLL